MTTSETEGAINLASLALHTFVVGTSLGHLVSRPWLDLQPDWVVTIALVSIAYVMSAVSLIFTRGYQATPKQSQPKIVGMQASSASVPEAASTDSVFVETVNSKISAAVLMLVVTVVLASQTKEAEDMGFLVGGQFSNPEGPFLVGDTNLFQFVFSVATISLVLLFLCIHSAMAATALVTKAFWNDRQQ